jgi:hypothetical protein
MFNPASPIGNMVLKNWLSSPVLGFKSSIHARILGRRGMKKMKTIHHPRNRLRGILVRLTDHARKTTVSRVRAVLMTANQSVRKNSL